MSRRLVPGNRHRSSSDVSDDFDSDDDLRNTGSLQAASSQQFRYLSNLSELGQMFARVKLGDYKRCRTFIRHHPMILREDPRNYLTAAERALGAGEKQLAKQCVQQSLLIRSLWQISGTEMEMQFYGLMQGRNSDSGFVEECNEALKKLEDRILHSPPGHDRIRLSSVGSIVPTDYVIPDEFPNGALDHRIDSLNSNIRKNRHESSSRLSSLGHMFIRILVDQSAQCREFLERYPAILDEDHELYISEALSAVRGGNESKAKSAIEKSIILRDFNRRRPEEVFQGLSRSVSSAMSILKRRAWIEGMDDTPGRMEPLTHPLQSTGFSRSDTSARNRERQLATPQAPYQPRAGEGDRPSPLDNILPAKSPRVLVVDTSNETAALKTSILQLRRKNEAVEQDLQMTRSVLKEQNQKVASTKQELEAAKKEVQKMHKELTREKQELKVRLEELQSARKELQSREKEFKGSEGQNQALQREKKELEAARKLQLLRDDELREKEKELNKTKMELDRERESIAQAKHEIEITRRPPGFDDPAEFEMPRTENGSNVNGFRYGSTIFGLLHSAATVFKTGIKQQQGSLVCSSSNVPFTPNDVSTSFTETDYLLEIDTPTPAGTEDESEDKDARTLGGRLDRHRRWNEVIQGLKFQLKEVEKREEDVEARELQVQFDQDKVKKEREIQSQRDRAAFEQQCHGCGIALAVNFELPE